MRNPSVYASIFSSFFVVESRSQRPDASYIRIRLAIPPITKVNGPRRPLSRSFKGLRFAMFTLTLPPAWSLRHLLSVEVTLCVTSGLCSGGCPHLPTPDEDVRGYTKIKR